MANYHGKSASVINAAMKEYLPETAGHSYADFPMARSRWYQPQEQTPDRQPCFVRTGNALPDGGIKPGYVWGPGSSGFGYYHLLTKAAHTTLYLRIQNRKIYIGPDGEGGVCCCFGEADPRTQMPKTSLTTADDIDDLRRLFHARSVAQVPHDGSAAADALSQAKGIAQSHYQTDQNVQLGMMIAGQAMAR